LRGGEKLEATPGIEPGYTVLQACAVDAMDIAVTFIALFLFV
jgi:hypothetical protein